MWKLELEKSNWRLLTPPVIAEHDILYPSKAQFSEFRLLCNDKMYENLILLTLIPEKWVARTGPLNMQKSSSILLLL